MKTKRYLFFVIVFVLVFTAACGGGAEISAPAEAPAVEAAAPAAEEQPADNPAEESADEPAEAAVETEFPLPEDTSNIMDLGNGAINFQTALSIPDVATFYRMAFPDYTEREILTIAEEGSLNLVFDGHESGQMIVVQGFPMGEGVTNVSIRLEAE